MKKTIHTNKDGTFTAVAGVQFKRCDSKADAVSFLSRFASRCHEAASMTTQEVARALR
jgi:hypothetical protein